MARLRTCRRSMAALSAACLLFAGPACAQPAPPGKAGAVKAPVPAPAPAPAPASASTSPAPARDRAPEWKAAKLYGVDYVSLAEVAARFGLKVDWPKPREQLRLRSQWTELVFELDKREFRWNGLRVFLGEPVITNRGTLWIAAIDIRTTLTTLLQPVGAPAPGPLRLIVLDPGHGGTDPGTQNAGLRLNEKTFTLDVAQRLKPLLEARGYRVLLTRETDSRFSNSPAVDLPMRADFANKAKADLFLSIHFNALANAEVHGIETYAFTPAGLRSSGQEERSPEDETAQPGNRQDHWNLVAAGSIHRQLRDQVDGFDRGLKRARWAVLRPLACPGVLIECGFLTNDAEARKINSPAHRQKIAEAIAAGVGDYAVRLAEATRPGS